MRFVAVGIILFSSLLSSGVVNAHGSLQVRSPTAPALCFSSARNGWAADGTRVLHTTDAGKTWTTSLSLHFRNHQITWTPSLGCSGTAAWALWSGSGQAMNQKPYVIYHTANSGKVWKAVFTEGYFSDLYPADARKVTRTVGAMPGPFTVVNQSTVYFIGISPPMPANKQVWITGTTSGGAYWQTHFLPCLTAMQPVAVTFADSSHGWVAGTCLNGQHAIVATMDGGRHWSVQTRNG